jgi:hypothetical protein
MHPTAREGKVLFKIHGTTVNCSYGAAPAGAVGKEQ